MTTGVEIRRYRPRVESSFARLECHRDLSNGDIHWERHAGNITHVFGRSAAARIADPADPRRVYRWLIEEQADAHGNLVAYTYAREDLLGVPAGSLPEAGRLASPAAEANVHLKRVQWGNRHPGSPGDWLFELVVDYGDHDPVHPDPQPDRPWTLRTDAHSSFAQDLMSQPATCRRLLMFSTYAQPGQTPVLLGAHEFTYRERPAGSELVTVTYRGYRDAAGEDPQTMTLPPVEFDYTQTGPPGSPVDVADTGHAGGTPGRWPLGTSGWRLKATASAGCSAMTGGRCATNAISARGVSVARSRWRSGRRSPTGAPPHRRFRVRSATRGLPCSRLRTPPPTSNATRRATGHHSLRSRARRWGWAARWRARSTSTATGAQTCCSLPPAVRAGIASSALTDGRHRQTPTSNPTRSVR